jgi:pyrimidine-nucleoside phosphorylase
MDQPLGSAVGNALEVREALATVRGEGPDDFGELVLDASARLLALSDLGIDLGEGRRRAESAVADGTAEATWRRWLEAQGGDADESALAQAPVVREVVADRAGTVARLGAVRVGNAALHLGAGRRTKEDPIDHAVGVVCRRKRGEAVEAGEVLAEVHARDDASAAAAVARVTTAAAHRRSKRGAGAPPACERRRRRVVRASGFDAATARIVSGGAKRRLRRP